MNILKKLTSRKFWVGIVGVIAPILVLFKMPESDIATVTALITACGSVIAYIFAETTVDVTREEKKNEEDE